MYFIRSLWKPELNAHCAGQSYGLKINTVKRSAGEFILAASVELRLRNRYNDNNGFPFSKEGICQRLLKIKTWSCVI